MPGTLVFLEHHEGVIQKGALGVLAKAVQLGGDVTGVLIGSGVRGIAESAGKFGAATVFVADDERLAAPLPQTRIDVLAKLVRDEGFDTVLFAQSVLAADIAAGLAARLDAGLNWDLVDLSADISAGRDDVLQYLKFRLSDQGAPMAMAVLADRISSAAEGNFLYARYVVNALIQDQIVGKLDYQTVWQLKLPEGGLYGIYRDYITREIHGNLNNWTQRLRPVLAVLAVVQGGGLSTGQLVPIVRQLTELPLSRMAVRDIVSLLRPFLDGAQPDGPFRIYHQSFSDFLVNSAANLDFIIDSADAHRAIFDFYWASDPLSWDDYGSRYLPVHATAAGRLDDLLGNAEFLAAATPTTLIPYLAEAINVRSRLAANVYRSAVHRLLTASGYERRQLLALAAARWGATQLQIDLNAYVDEDSWLVEWATGSTLSVSLLAALHGHHGPVNDVAVGQIDGQPVAISCDEDGTLRMWDLRAYIPIAERHKCHTGAINTVEIGKIGDIPVALTGGADGTVRAWNLRDLSSLGKPLVQTTEELLVTSFGEIDGFPVALAGGRSKELLMWDMRKWPPQRLKFEGDRASTGTYVSQLTLGTVQGAPIAVTGDTLRLQLWDLRERSRWGESFMAYHNSAFALCFVEHQGVPLVVCSGEAGHVWIWNLSRRDTFATARSHWLAASLAHRPLGSEAEARGLSIIESNTFNTRAIEAGVIAGDPVAITGGDDGALRVWNLREKVLADRLDGHPAKVTAIALAEVNERPIAVSGGEDGTIRIWDLGARSSAMGPVRAHDRLVRGVAAGRDGNTPLAVSVGDDGKLRVWNLDECAPYGDRVVDYPRPLRAVAMTEIDGVPIVVSSDMTNFVRVWDIHRMAIYHETATDPGIHSEIDAIAISVTSRRQLVVTAEEYQVLCIWEIGTKGRRGRMTGHISPRTRVFALQIATVNGEETVVAGGENGSVQIWRLTDQPMEVMSRLGHQGSVRAVASHLIAEGPVAATVGDDGVVRLWDLRTNEDWCEPIVGKFGPLLAVALGNIIDVPIVAFGGEFCTVHVFDLRARRLLSRIALTEPVRGLAIGADGRLIIGFGYDIAVYKLQPGAIRGGRISTREIAD